MTLVDSSAWIEFLRRKGDPVAKDKVARLLEAGLTAYTCPIEFELLSGVKPAEEADLKQALHLSQHIPFTRADWHEAALLERKLRSSGVTIPRNDLFVATVAIRAGLTLSCRDTHFDAISRVVGKELKIAQL
jgi:predicted nucleic acid-binding protein